MRRMAGADPAQLMRESKMCRHIQYSCADNRYTGKWETKYPEKERHRTDTFMSVLYRSSPLFHLLQEALGNLLHKFLEPAKRHGAFIKFFRPFHHIEAVSPFHKPINPPERVVLLLPV